MAVHIKHFDRNKAIELIVFIAENLKSADMHSVSKILYLADKLHLQEYGRLICGDKYIAMDYGPVPSAIYDMMKVADNRFTLDADWDELINEAIEVSSNHRNVKPKRKSDKEKLSDSEVECLKITINDYGKKTFGELTDITHDDAWKMTNSNETISLDSIVSTLPNSEEVLEYIHSF